MQQKLTILPIVYQIIECVQSQYEVLSNGSFSTINLSFKLLKKCKKIEIFEVVNRLKLQLYCIFGAHERIQMQYDQCAVLFC